MSFNYQNPLVGSTTTGPNSPTSLDRDYGTNFSVYNIGGYMEVQSLSDLEYTYEGTGNIYNSGNTIPIKFNKSPNVLTDKVFLWNDGISSGRRRLGMLVFVQENQTTYQFTIDNYETLYNNADSAGCVVYDGSTYYEVRNKVGITANAAGQALMDAWTGSTIEGVSGVTRENATWRVFWGTDWQITGGTYNSGTGTLSLDNNTGGTINVTGFTSGGGSDTYVTGGTYSSETTTLTLSRNDGNTVDITGFTSGGGGSLTLQDVTDNGSSTTNGISVASLTSTGDITINVGITAGNGGGSLTGNTVFGGDGLVVNTTGDKNTAFGYNTLSGNTEGNQNTGFGYQSLATNIDGDDNTSLGHWALYSNNHGSDNVAVGSDALFSSQPNRSVAVGKSALSPVSGDDNIGIGYQSGVFTSTIQPNSSATNSIYIGTNTKSQSSGGQNELVIGFGAVGNGSNTITLGNSSHTDTYLFGTVHGVPFISGGTYSSGTLTLSDADGGSFDITGFTSGVGSDTYVTGGTYTNATGTLELNRNDGNSINVTGFLTGSTGSQNLQQVLDNGNVSNTGMYISGATLTATTVDINGGYIDGVVLGSVSPVTITSNSATITGGYLNGVVLGNTSPVTITSNNATITGGYLNGVVLGNVTPVTITSNNATITSGNINGTNIGLTTRGPAGFTYIYDNNGSTGTTGQILSTTTTGITWTDSSSTDYYVTGGTLSVQGTLTLTRNDGNDVTVTGFTAQESDTFVTGGTYTDTTGIITLRRNDGGNFNISGFEYIKSLTLNNNDLEITPNIGSPLLGTVNAITGLGYNGDWGLSGSSTGVFYLGTELPFITGGTYSSGTITLGINKDLESDITISGLNSDDTYLTGATYSPTTLTLGMNDGTDFTVTGFAAEITGGTYNNGTLSLENNTGSSVDITGITFSSTNIYSNDGQLTANRVVDQNSNTLTFSGGSVSMGTNTQSPVCAILELASTNQGLLIPRMTQVQRLAINTPLPGLLVYCTNSDGNGDEGMYMYKSNGWVNVL